VRMMLIHGGIAVIALAIAGGCALRGPRTYVRVAEGLTSPTLAEGIRVAPRMFTAPDLVRACQNPRTVDRLKTATASLELQVGERFPLSSLTIVAVSASDVAMPDVPIAIEAEDAAPPILQLRSDDPDLNQGVLSSLNTGRFRLRIRTLCGIPGAETIINGRIEP
jgi:hypothetical protein